MSNGHGREPAEDDELDAIELWVLPYFTNSSLWPVLLVVLAALIAFVATALLYAVRDRAPLGIVASGLMIVGTLRAVLWEWKLRGRPIPIGVTLGLVWGLAAVTAWYGARAGLL